MIITDQRILEQVKIIPPRLNILQFRVEFDGTLVGLDIYLSAALTGFGFLYFGVNVNGTSIFATYPDDYINIPNGDDHGEVTGLSIPVVKGDIITLDVLGNARRNLGAFLTFMAHIDNGVGAVPAGGTTGQVLTKQSGADGDADWEDAGGGGSSFGIYSPDPPYGTPSTEDDEFNTGSLDAKWITNISNAPPTITWPIPNCASFAGVTGGAAQAIMQSVSNVDQTYRMKIAAANKQSGAALQIGFAVRSGSNRWDVYAFDQNSRVFRQYQCFNPGAVYMQNNLLDISGTGVIVQGNLPAMYLELQYTASGTGVAFRYSFDGLNFWQVWSASTVLGDPISHVGIHAQGNNTTSLSHVDWFRKLQGAYTGGTV